MQYMARKHGFNFIAAVVLNKYYDCIWWREFEVFLKKLVQSDELDVLYDQMF